MSKKMIFIECEDMEDFIIDNDLCNEYNEYVEYQGWEPKTIEDQRYMYKSYLRDNYRSQQCDIWNMNRRMDPAPYYAPPEYPDQ